MLDSRGYPVTDFWWDRTRGSIVIVHNWHHSATAHPNGVCKNDAIISKFAVIDILLTCYQVITHVNMKFWKFQNFVIELQFAHEM